LNSLNPQQLSELDEVLYSASEKTPQARILEAQGYEAWLKTLGSRTFTKPFAPFHHRFWQWYWPARLKLLRGEKLSPDELTALLIWGRGMGKSSHVEWACIAEGALNEGDSEPGFVGYVCLTEALAKGHIKSIRNRLDSPQILEYYPGLSNPLVDKHGYQSAWRQDFLATSSHWGIIPIGLEEGVRGGRLFDLRFTMWVFDDIDSRKVSSAVVKKTLDTIAYEILPAGTPQTLKLVPQNLVREDGALAQIFSRESDVLSRRIVIGTEDGQPLPAFEEVELELDDSRPGAYSIKSAIPVWDGLDLDAAEVFLSDSGRAGFFAEYQHRFDVDRTDYILSNYEDEVHAITRSQFEDVYQTRTVPFYWGKRWFNDWAKTKTAKHANVAGCLSVSAQNTRLPGIAFLSDCLTFDAGTEADEVALRILKTIFPTVTVNGQMKTWEEVCRDSFTRQNLETYGHSVTEFIDATRDARSRVIPPLVGKMLNVQNVVFRGSHEQNKNALKVYRDVYGLPFHPCNPGADGGIELLNHLMKVDKTKRHPFKEDELLPDGTYKLGFSRFYVVCEDQMADGPKGHNPAAMNDSDLARYQLKWWKSAPLIDNATGEVERGPEKRLDDFGNGLMMSTHDGLPSAVALTYNEKVQTLIPDKYKRETLKESYAPEKEMSVAFQEARARQMIKPTARQWNYLGEEIGAEEE
jgi:hypothetical protein